MHALRPTVIGGGLLEVLMISNTFRERAHPAAKGCQPGYGFRDRPQQRLLRVFGRAARLMFQLAFCLIVLEIIPIGQGG